MNYNYYKLIITLIFISSFSFAQQMPIDFSDASDNFNGFSGSGFSFNVNPTDTNNDIGQFFNDGTIPWQGFYLDLLRPINLDFQKTITLSFYSFDANSHEIILKLENGTNQDVEVSQLKSSSGWTNTIAFDFSNAISSDDSTPVNATGTYNRLTIFIDGGSTIAGTYLIDIIDDGSTPTDPNAIDIEYADLVWADEFDIEGAVNSANWHHQTQVIIPGVGWANGEEQHYTNSLDNSFVDDSGFLNIVAIKEDVVYVDQGVSKDYTSARLNSKFAFTYGRVDVRAKLPSGDGTWPAIWTLGKNINEDGGFWDSSFGTTNWPACGEIDIMEHGLGATNHVSSALHTPCCNSGSPNTSGIDISDVANNFHVYSVNWSPDQITFLIDNVGFYTYNPSVKDASTWPFFEDQYILLNVAMGGVSGTIDPSFSRSSMIIDYVRVYQNNGLSTDEIDANKFRIFPNPSSDYFSIDSKKVIDKFELYDVLGNLILDKRKPTKNIDVSGLNAGIYLLNIYSENKKVTKKVVIN